MILPQLFLVLVSVQRLRYTSLYYTPAKSLKGSPTAMQDAQLSVRAASTTRTLPYRVRSSRLSRSMLVGVAVSLLLTCVEIVTLWILYPWRPASTNVFTRLVTVLALPIHEPFLWLIPLGELVVVAVLAFMAAKPLALSAYVRDVQRVQEDYRASATSLQSLADVYNTPVTYYQHTPNPADTSQGQTMPLRELSEQARETSLLLMGDTGTGKTLALQQQHYQMSQARWALMRGQQNLCLYIPLRNYSLFLKEQRVSIPPDRSEDTATAPEATTGDTVVRQGTFLTFLLGCDLAGMDHLRPYLKKLLGQGRLMLLCDGLDEVDATYRSAVGRELAELLLVTQNRFVFTCREVDYQEQPELANLVNEGHLDLAVIDPLPVEMIRQFVEQYIHDQGNHWQHTAGQIMQVVDHSRLRYLCTNPLMLFTFMEIIDKVGVERGKTLDTRGRLLREYVSRHIKRTQAQPTWRQHAPTAQEVGSLLSRVACAAHWSHNPDAIHLPGATSKQGSEAHFTTLAHELLDWLVQHPAQRIFAVEQPEPSYDAAKVAEILHFAQDAGLIELSSTNKESHDGTVLSFRHTLMAAYFVAEYFFSGGITEQPSPTAITEDILHDIGYWNVPIALWAGLADHPTQLAEQFIALGKNHADDALPVAMLSLICLGVAWTPPQATIQPTQRGDNVPHAVVTALASILRNPVARAELARLFTTCADEGAFELYRALFSVLMVEGIDELLVLLDASIVLDLLFTYLQDIADIPAYESQVKRLCRALWRFGKEAVPFANALSQPGPNRSIRLRSAAINILGGTQHEQAVEPLMERLGDSEKFVVERATSALLRLGPALSLETILAALENHAASPLTHQIHTAILLILERLLREQESKAALAMAQYQSILDVLILVLSASYSWESDIQRQARLLLVQLGKGQAPLAGTALPTVPLAGKISPEKQEQTITQLLHYLASGDEMLAQHVMLTLQEIGETATPYLVEQLHQQPAETLRLRVVQILQNVHDPNALPAILRLVADISPLVQKQVAAALQTFGKESITGLIELVQTDGDAQVAERAAHILSNMGEQAVMPTTQALARIVPERTRLLVLVLDTIHDPWAIPALVDTLQNPLADPLLAIAIIRTLSHFATQQVVRPILSMLASPHVQIYEEAIEALSALGLIALDELIAALDVTEEMATTARVQRAILGIVPFPGELLLQTLPRCSDVQAQHIMTVFHMQGADAAHILVQQLFHENERTRRYIRETLSEMPGPIAVPPLLEALTSVEWRPTLAEFLLTFPEAAIPPLVNLLGDQERDKAAAAILPRFGPDLLPSLISGLDDPRIVVQEHSQHIIVVLVRQNAEALTRVVHLFALPLPLRAHESLLEVLTNELVEVSIPALLTGLEDAHLIDDVSEALVRLARKRDCQQMVLGGLLAALHTEERRRGAETALIKMGALAVRPVGELIIDKDPVVAQAAQHILSAIGVPALAFIWTAHGDTSNRARREAAMAIFQDMPTEVIKDALVDLLSSDRPEDIAMAQALLLERIHDESTLPQANHEMIPGLLEYVQIHDREHSSLRILALLLLLGGNQVISHLVQVLYDQPDHHEQLAHAFLFLGEEARAALMNILNDPHAPTRLRAEAISILGLLGADKDLYEYAQSLSSYGLSANRTSILKPDQLAIALRALGSLLASGDWDIATLQNLRRITPEGSAQSELYQVLLGWRYEPELAHLKSDLQNEREARKNEIMSLTARIVQDQLHIREVEEELEQVRHEHGVRGDELFQATQEREDFRSNVAQITQESTALRLSLNQSVQERDVFRANLEQTLQEKQALQAEIAQLESYNAVLQQQIRTMRGIQ